MEPTVAPPNPAAGGPPPERVGFGSRLGAYVIDLVIVWGAAALAARPLSGLFPHAIDAALAAVPAAGPGAQVAETVARIAIAATMIVAVYFLIEGLFGRALGKLILGLRIAADDARGAPLGRLFPRALVKTSGSWVKIASLATGATALGKGANVLGVVVFGGCLLALWPRRQALHDLIARTAVFHASDVGSPR